MCCKNKVRSQYFKLLTIMLAVWNLENQQHCPQSPPNIHILLRPSRATFCFNVWHCHHHFAAAAPASSTGWKALVPEGGGENWRRPGYAWQPPAHGTLGRSLKLKYIEADIEKAFIPPLRMVWDISRRFIRSESSVITLKPLDGATYLRSFCSRKNWIKPTFRWNVILGVSWV